MSTKLNQIIAVLKTRKGQAQKVITGLHHRHQKADLITGLIRTYQPLDDEGERLPPESKSVQVRVTESIQQATDTLSNLYDLVATQDIANTQATADLVVDGSTLANALPVTYLLFLEKQMEDLRKFIDTLPTLDPSRGWDFNEATNCYTTPERTSVRTKKVLRNHEKAPATKEHPAQVEVYTEDVQVGSWTNRDLSGGIPVTQKADMLRRVNSLLDAIKQAREAANSLEVTQQSVGDAILGYVFGQVVNVHISNV